MNNALPVIESIAVQGRRANQPARMADLRETVDVMATVTDAETPVEQLTYQWTATAGTFSGTGRQVTWTAPESATTPATVTITLRVTERYGTNSSHEVMRTQTLALHDSTAEVGRMSREFLVAFSTTSIKDWQVVMKDFNRSACPVPREYDDERDQVVNHYTNFTMISFDVGAASVSVDFGGSCAYALPGDACASVPVMWDSTGPSGRSSTSGIDHLTAVYSTVDSRWWLCSSRYEVPTSSVGHAFYSR